MRLTLDEYSKQFKMSKEMIKSKLRLKKLNFIVEDSVTYIIVKSSNIINGKSTPTEQAPKKITKTTPKQKPTVATVIALYQRENIQLKEKIMQLEIKIDKLVDDKEQMLRDERDKIEELYSKKDEQLKTILELMNTKMMLENPNQTIHEVQEVQSVTVEKLKPKSDKSTIELKEYLKTLSIKDYQKKIIKKRFLLACNSDIRILQKNGKLFLDFNRYDYTDLLLH